MQNNPTRLWQLLFMLTDRLRELNDEEFSPKCQEDAFNLTINQTRVIRVVKDLTDRNVGEVTLKSLSERLQITAAAASEMVETLVQKGVLSREQSRTDRRAISVRLSEFSCDFIRRRQAEFEQTAAAFLATLSREDEEKLLALLEAFQCKIQSDHPTRFEGKDSGGR